MPCRGHVYGGHSPGCCLPGKRKMASDTGPIGSPPRRPAAIDFAASGEPDPATGPPTAMSRMAASDAKLPKRGAARLARERARPSCASESPRYIASFGWPLVADHGDARRGEHSSPPRRAVTMSGAGSLPRCRHRRNVSGVSIGDCYCSCDSAVACRSRRAATGCPCCYTSLAVVRFRCQYPSKVACITRRDLVSADAF